MKWARLFLALAALAACVPACRKGETAEAERAKRYTLKGVIRDVNAARSEITVEHESIPDFMAGTPLEQVLSLVAGADETAAEHAMLREIHGPNLGPISVVFRVFRPVQSDYSLGSNRPLLDGSSRPILAAEGWADLLATAHIMRLALLSRLGKYRAIISVALVTLGFKSGHFGK